MSQDAATVEAYRAIAIARWRELPTRIGIACAVTTAIFFDGQATFALIYAVLVLVTQAIDAWVFTRLRTRRQIDRITWRHKLIANLSVLAATAAYGLASVAFWSAWGSIGQTIAALFLCGALFHIALHSSQNLMLTLAGGGPHAAYLIGLPLSAMMQGDGLHIEYGLIVIAAGLFLMHFISAARRFGSANRRIRNAQLRAEQANLAKSRFLANMSHEIRTPLNGVMGMAQLLARTDLTSTQKHYVQTLNSSGSALRSLIDDVLDISRIEAGELALDTGKYRPADLLRATADMIAGPAAAKGVKIELDIDPALERAVLGDGPRMRQILTNFAGNAVKFTEAGSIAIQGRMDGAEAMELSVADTGPGIAPEALSRIFDRFSQVDDTLGRHHEGAGLGLAIARELAVLAGGRIGADSEPGAGSRFWVQLPCTPAPEQDAGQAGAGPSVKAAPVTSSEPRSAAPAHAALPDDSPTALIIEDNPVNRELLSAWLPRLGWRTLEANSGEAGLAMLETATPAPDVILLDLHMPGMSGETVLQTLAARHGSIPVFMITADVTAGTAQRLLEQGAARCFSKPLELSAIATALSELKAARAA
jgi:signal transduction histidine kinase/ActR/RegA family two-component response regulator